MRSPEAEACGGTVTSPRECAERSVVVGVDPSRSRSGSIPPCLRGIRSRFVGRRFGIRSHSGWNRSGGIAPHAQQPGARRPFATARSPATNLPSSSVVFVAGDARGP